VEIGTAKPSRAERARIPHHLLDWVEPHEHISAGMYASEARRVLGEVQRRGKLPIVAGGTGLYLRALVNGLFPGPQRSEQVRARLRNLAEKKGSGYLHRILCRLDGEAADRIHANDTAKLVRAIEVCLQTKSKLTTLWQRSGEPLEGFRILRLGLSPDRQALYLRIDQRAKKMFDDGLVEETSGLQGKYGADAWPLRALGYRQAMQELRGELDRGGAIAAAQQAHRNYAKRQMTWFRREPDVHWLHGFGDERGVQEQASLCIGQPI
jgi:tRNA dimethylallyltransferase